jgi:uncharacterized membrane protein
MSEFFIALIVFLAAHLLPAAPRLRGTATRLLGLRLYLALYSALSIVLLAWVVVAAQRADSLFLWDPTPWQRWVPLAAMPFALFLVIAGLGQANPLSVSLRTASAGRPGSVVGITRHPVLWGFLIWALAHIPPNGDLVALVLFGGMALLAAAGMRLVDARARKRLGGEWAALAERTSVIPFVAAIAGRASLRFDRELAIAALVSLVLYGWLLWSGHQLLFGVDPLAGLT